MLLKAFLVAFAMWACHLTGYHAPNMMLDRPIFLGPLVGLILGNFELGCIIGAQLELIFMGVVFVGSATSADPGASAAIAVSFAILNNLSVNEAIAVATPIGYLCALAIAMEPAIGEIFTPMIDKFLMKDDYRGWTIGSHCLSFIELSIGAVFVFLAVLFGGDLVSAIMGSLPEFVLTGVNAAGAMLPVVGLAVLTSQLWDKKTALYFLFGFFLMKYLNLDILFLAIIAVFIALRDVFSYFDQRKLAAEASVLTETPETEEEDFFR